MSKNGPIIIIDDDIDDQQLVCEIIKDLQVTNEQRLFTKSEDFLNYLLTTNERPFIIFCDVNIPMMSGLELHKKINETAYLRKKAIPFVFFTTSVDLRAVEAAYELSVQGYFEKPMSYSELKSTLKVIIDYWKICKHPNCY